MKSLSFLILSVLMICSCSNKDKKDSKLTENQVKNQAKKSKLEKNFLGIWRIDSIGENNKKTFNEFTPQKVSSLISQILDKF